MNAGSGATYTFTCGLNGPTMSATPTVAELLTQQTVDTTTFSNTPANTLATVPASNAMLTFTPPNVTPAAPISLTFTAVTASSMTVGWTDNSTDETTFSVLRSTDNVNFSVMGNIPSTTTGTTGTAYSLAQTGLTPGVTYYFQVSANTEGIGSSLLTGSQATTSPGTVASIASGNWGDTTTWSTGEIPTAGDNVTIADGTTVTINVAASCYNLTVGQTASGVLQYETTTARTLTVVQSAAVAAGGTFQTGATGTVTTHVLSIGGNLTNDGTIDFSTNTNTAGAGITFTGAGNATFGGTGGTTDLRALTVNKGTSSANVLEVSPSNLTVRGVSTDVAGFVTLTNGTLKLAGAYTLTNRLFSSASYSVPATAGLWLANPNLIVAGQNGSPSVTGLLRITSGTFNVGTATGNSITFATGANVIVEGGAVNVAGRWAISTTTSVITYNQSGGTLTLNTATGHTSTTYASFDMGTASGTSVTISGGTIILRNAGTATSGPRDYRNNAGVQSLGGGTLQLGDASSGTHKIYVVQGSVPELVLTNTSAAHTARLAAQTNVYLNTTIAANDSLQLNGYIFIQIGGTLTNNGIIDGTVASSRLYFLGAGAAKTDGGANLLADGTELPVGAPAGIPPLAVAQTYTGAGSVATPLDGLSIDNTSGVTIDNALAANVITLRVNLFRGTLTNSNMVTLGNAGTTGAVTQIGAAGIASAGGSYDVAPVFNAGSGGYQVLYAQEGVARTTGNEIPAGRSMYAMSIGNPNGVTLAGGNLTLTNGFTLSSGLFTTDASNLLVLANTLATPPAGSATSYVAGPLAIEFNVASATDRTYAIGKSGAFRPLALKQVNTGGVAQTYQAEVIASPPGGTPLPPLLGLDPARYWTVSNTANLNATARVNLGFAAADGVASLSTANVAQANTAGGSYASLGGATTGTPLSGTVESTADLTPGDDYFTIGFGVAPIVWDGGAATSNWGDAANWDPDGVPTGSDNVSLTQASATAIDVDGNYAVQNLEIGNYVTLSILGTNTLTLTGGLQQGGSAINVGTGALSITGSALIAGGTLNLNSGTMTVDGSFALTGAAMHLDSGVLDVRGAFASTSGFVAETGTTIFSGTAAQAIGGSVTHYNLIFRNGGVGASKILSAGPSFAVANDLTVETTAQLALSAATATNIPVAGNLFYSGATGGANIASLTLTLTGAGKTIAGAAAKASPPVIGPNADKIRLIEVDYLTDPAKADVASRTLDDEKPAVVLENTYALRQAEVAKLLATTDPEARLVVNLDDMTIIRNPASFTQFLVQPTTFEMAVTIASGGVYTLADNIAIGAGKLVTVSGRLNCATYTISGGGGVSVPTGSFGNGTLGIGAPTGGVGSTVLTTGTNSYSDGSSVDYYASGDQIIHTASHPAAAMLYTSGSGTKALDGDKTITGSSGSALTKGALAIGAGTTFADAGYTLSFTTSGYANVLANGTYASTGSGGLSYQSGPFLSNIVPVDGTTFGNLTLNFSSSTSTVDMNATGAVNVSFRNLICGGTAGTGTGGGTLKLNDTGTTIVTVTDSLSIRPATVTSTGGGFGGVTSTTGTVYLRGPLVSTSTNSTQPIMNATGTNTLILAGPAAQVIHLTAAVNPVTMFTGSTLKIDNAAGVTLASTARTYGIGGTLNLTSGNITTGVNTLLITSTGSVTRASGHVVGNLAKNFSSTGLARTMEIGSAGAYAPVDVAFASISTAGNLTATTFDGDHPSIGTSGLNPAATVNRYHRLTNGGIVFTTADATFSWDAGDVDPGADPNSFALGKYDAGVWSYPTIGSRTPTSIGVTGLTSLSDYAVGNIGLTIADVAVNEGNAGTTNADFTVTLGIAPQSTVTVDYATADGTATAPGDYTAIAPPVTLTWNPGDPAAKTVTVLVNGDATYEPDETFLLNLTNPAGASFLDNQAQGTILNDDGVPSFTIDDVAVTEGDAGPSTGKRLAVATFTVTLSNPAQQVVTVDYETADGTATAPGDYTAITPPQTLTFNPGDPLTQTVSVTVIGDVITEPDETFFVNLTNAVNATIADNQGQGTILNDDNAPSFAINDVAVTEGNSGTSLATFTVTLSNPAQQVVTVDYATADGTATAPSDYVAIAAPLTLTFNPGDPLTRTVSVTVNGDLFAEADETFFVNLSNAVNATITDGQGQGTIQNDDATPGFTVSDVTVTEGNAGTTPAVFTVTLSGPSSFVVTVQVATADGTATAPSDYTAIAPPQTLTFNPGDPLTQTVTVLVNGDTTVEPDETFFVNLANAVNATIVDGQGQCTILNDETVSVPEAAPVVTATYVGTNYPNPFSGATTIPVGLVSGGQVRIRIYDATGRLVRTVVDQSLAAGVQNVTWDGLDNRGTRVASGFYVVRVEAEGKHFTRMLKVVR